MEGKPFWQSKTMWVSLLTTTLGVLEMADLSFIPDQWEGLTIVIIGLAMAWLRVITDSKVST